MSRRAAALVSLVTACALWAAGCREATAPYEPPDEQPTQDALRQLTFSPGDDREPTWSTGGDTVFYTAESFGDLPSSAALLVGVPSVGGVAKPMLNVAQTGTAQRRLVTVDVSPDGTYAAFVQVIALHPEELCAGAGSACGDGSVGGPPSLDRAAVRVREIESIGPVSGDPARDIAFEGRFFDTSRQQPGVGGTWIVTAHPFQVEFDMGGLLPVHPSWAPTGDRLVFSDGLRLFIWNVSAASEAAIPGSEDGVLPAWSPDGQWIAYTRHARGPGGTTACQWFAPGKDGVPVLQCIEERTVWPFYVSEIWVSRPDGSDARRLAAGTQPAWTPGSSGVYYVANGQIWRTALAGGAPESVPGTTGGVDPAVSPDGTELAFARSEPGEGHDVWILDLEAGQ